MRIGELAELEKDRGDWLLRLRGFFLVTSSYSGRPFLENLYWCLVGPNYLPEFRCVVLRGN